MNILVCETPEAAGELVANEILAAIRRKPELVLGLATGSTPIGIYARLVRAHRDRQVDFSVRPVCESTKCSPRLNSK